MEAPRYSKHVFWSDEDDGFIAIAPDLPGSSAFGETEAEALAELDQAINAWIDAARAAGNPVPAASRPASPSLPSGKVLVRMPRTLHQSLVREAGREDVSLNQFIVFVLSKYSEVAAPRSTATAPTGVWNAGTSGVVGFINTGDAMTRGATVVASGSTLHEPWYTVQSGNLTIYGEHLANMATTIGKLSINY
jgi:predicted RNase H-like HicB family nuclease